MTDRIRLTITVSSETHEVFSRISEAAGVSLGRAMGDWLADTHEGALFVAGKMEEARQAPVAVMRQFQAHAMGMHDEATRELDAIRKRRTPGPTARLAQPGGQPGPGFPPSSNTGGKSPSTSTSRLSAKAKK